MSEHTPGTDPMENTCSHGRLPDQGCDLCEWEEAEKEHARVCAELRAVKETNERLRRAWRLSTDRLQAVLGILARAHVKLSAAVQMENWPPDTVLGESGCCYIQEIVKARNYLGNELAANDNPSGKEKP